MADRWRDKMFVEFAIRAVRNFAEWIEGYYNGYWRYYFEYYMRYYSKYFYGKWYYYDYYGYTYGDDDESGPGQPVEEKYNAWTRSAKAYALIDQGAPPVEGTTPLAYGLPTGSTMDVYARDNSVFFLPNISDTATGWWVTGKSKNPPWIIPMTAKYLSQLSAGDAAELSGGQLYSSLIGNDTQLGWPDDDQYLGSEQAYYDADPDLREEDEQW